MRISNGHRPDDQCMSAFTCCHWSFGPRSLVIEKVRLLANRTTPLHDLFLVSRAYAAARFRRLYKTALPCFPTEKIAPVSRRK